MLVCRACYEQAPPGTKPWQPFVCKCYVPNPKSRLGRKLAEAKKKAKNKKGNDEQER